MVSSWTWTSAVISKISIEKPKRSADQQLCEKHLLALRAWQDPSYKRVSQWPDAAPVHPTIIPVPGVMAFKPKKWLRYFRWRRVVFLDEALSAEAERQVPTPAFLPCLPYLSLHCPHPIKVRISDVSQPLPPKFSTTGAKQAQRCPVRPCDSFGVGAGGLKAQSGCQCKRPVWAELLQRPAPSEAAGIEVAATNKGNSPRVEQRYKT